MLPYTIDQNFAYGYGDGLFNPQDKTPGVELHCSYARATRIPESFRLECIRTAQILSEQAKDLGRVPVVLLSGGLDSEVVVKAFLEAGVEFKTITFRHADDLNDFEMRYVEKFCARHGLENEYLDIDILKWAPSAEAKQLFIDSHCHFYEMIPHMKLLTHVWNQGGLPIMGNGDLFLEKDEHGEWQYVEFEFILGWFRHAIRHGILGGVGFFQHTPEITLAALRDPQFEKIGLNNDTRAQALLKNGRMAKYVMYRKHWPDLEHRPKFNGGEKLHLFYDRIASPLRAKRQVTFNDKWLMPYAQFRALHEPN